MYIQILFLFHLGLQRLESKTVYLQYHPCNETILSLNRFELSGKLETPIFNLVNHVSHDLKAETHDMDS